MTTPVTHADLVARASGVLEGEARDRVDRALAEDPKLREQFETVAAHLLIYDAFPEAPEPPAFERIAEALDAMPQARVAGRDLPRAAPRRRVAPLAWTAAAAAVLVAVGLLAVLGTDDPDRRPRVRIHAAIGSGVEILREGAPWKRVPAGDAAAVSLASGDVLRAERPAEVTLAERVRVVLDADSPLRIEARDVVRLAAGRAWFEVEPGAFRVHTPYGPVDVLGTRFEIDLRYGGLRVGVDEGRVRAASEELGAGMALAPGTGVHKAVEAPGRWFSEPVLEVARTREGRMAPGQALELEVDVVNPNYLRLEAPGPASDRTGLYAVIQRLAADGRWKGLEQPLAVTEANILSGESVVRPGQPVILGGGERRGLTLQLLSPFAEPGTYRVRVGYHPEGRPPIVSAPLEIEVAR